MKCVILSSVFIYTYINLVKWVGEEEQSQVRRVGQSRRTDYETA